LRVARNAAIDRHRRRGTRRRLLTALGRLPRATAPPAEAEALEREDDRAFRHRLAALPDAQRDALALRYGADLTIADVATVMGKSQDATQKLISRGLARLKETHHDAD
jgi:RNA polymerase sigma-70 factor (ECF subfamily)